MKTGAFSPGLKDTALHAMSSDDVPLYFDMDNLTDKQKHAFDLAVEHGYYGIPKRTDLAKLSRMMKISLATYQEHLRRAESKIIPSLNTT